MKNRIIFSLMIGLLFFSSCEPNEELYEELDQLQKPYSRDIQYTLTSLDYTSVGGDVASQQAFSESQSPQEHIPGILADQFLGLNQGSSALVNFNYLVEEPIWEQAAFGYELTEEDYAYIGISDEAFSESNPARNYLATFLRRRNPDAQQGDERSIIYNYEVDGETVKNMDTYVFNGSSWEFEDSVENVPFVGYELTAGDYEAIGGDVAAYGSFSEDVPANKYIPVFLKNKFPYAVPGDEQVVRYRFFADGATSNQVAHYTFDGTTWNRTSNIEVRSEQYIHGAQGWAFDPTVNFVMRSEDYMYLVVIDPIPHPVYDDFGFYYGASAYYSNFDMRLEARRVQLDESTGTYFDTALGAIYESEGGDAAVEEMMRRLIEEGLIKLLQEKYPDATPQSGGIDVHYIVGFETFNDNYSRSYLEAEYRVVSAGTPPVFELVDGPRERE